MSESEKKFKPCAMNDTKLMAMYGVGYKTWQAWMKPIREKVGEMRGKAWSPAQVRIIIEHLGDP